METLCHTVFQSYSIIDPYSGKAHEFESEQQAYDCFQATCGLDHYCELVSRAIRQNEEALILIGFSVGASAIWMNAGGTTSNVMKAVCFYGSQIRHAIDIQPQFPVTLVMPEREPHFSVKGLSETLSAKPSVEIIQSGYQHGFMNQHSKHFNHSAYLQYLDRVVHFIDTSGNHTVQ